MQDVINTLAAYGAASEKTYTGKDLDDAALGRRNEAADKQANLNRNAPDDAPLCQRLGIFRIWQAWKRAYWRQKSIDLEKHSISNAIDEERRLCYVGVTRIRDRLTMTLSCQQLHEMGGKAAPRCPGPGSLL